ncbi:MULTISPECIES: response regulator [Prosthecochloris]|uniref:Response regulator n=1 Tax=Prosthecochloris vibrioformis TaxID=1098 RepID=A0A5C4S1F2_PROVB|nr:MULTISPECIES: response regulator [Prosthecochloris]ANT64936.1 Phosphate regulon transcriptional regulatory protein PhoB [Prosthecochloris sp. CIB 2401]TNJ36988.1 response regulator [Prosthecochloris vibrioformis]
MNNNKHTILLVEDEPHTKRLISYSLTSNGFHVLEAENGQKALEVCEKSIPDLIISDVMMPVLDGLELRKQLLLDDRLNSIPFIFLSARAQTHEVIRAEKLKPNAYITKPVEPDEIIEIIHKLLSVD